MLAQQDVVPIDNNQVDPAAGTWAFKLVVCRAAAQRKTEGSYRSTYPHPANHSDHYSPSVLHEMLVMPGFGLDEGRYNFFMKPDQAMQLVAVEDIGKFVAAIFADELQFSGKTLDIASDTVTGKDLEGTFTQMAGIQIRYARTSDDVLEPNPFLRKLSELRDDGTLDGKADLDSCRMIVPDLQCFGYWLAEAGRDVFEAVLGTSRTWAYNT